MTDEELVLHLKALSLQTGSTIIVSTTEDFLSQLPDHRASLSTALTSSAAPEEILFADENISDLKYQSLLEKNTLALFIGTDYESNPVLRFARNLSRRKFSNEAEEKTAFRLAGTALENRFWGDEDVIRFAEIGETQCRIINFKLLTDYVADWIFKNYK